MKAIHVLSDQPGRPLAWRETARPDYGPDDVLVNVHAAALNRADLAQRDGHYPPPPGAPDTLGLDMAGVIAEMGDDVSGWCPGDRVCALLPGGGYAEQVAVPQRMLMAIPDDWSFVDAAALPEAYLTAFVNVFMEGGFRPGDTVLCHGGSGGVGMAVIQLVRAAGGRVIVTAGSDEKTAACRRQGAALAINYHAEDFAERTLDFTDGQGVDIVIDMVGGEYLERNLRVLRPQGRLVFIATQGGTRGEINIGLLMAKRLRLIGSVLRARAVEEKVEIRRRFIDLFWPQLIDGTIRPVIDSVYPVEQAEAAQQRMAAGEHIGKIVLKVRE
jgi:putative PIG3 family NAD(P)H quinone oxidoreductase